MVEANLADQCSEGEYIYFFRKSPSILAQVSYQYGQHDLVHIRYTLGI